VARNAGLGAVAVAIAIELGAGVAAVAISGTAAALILPAALRSRRAAPASDDRGLEPGLRAPVFALPAAEGITVGLEVLRARRLPVLLVFSDPDCGPCRILAPQIARWQHAHAAELTIAVIERRDGGDGAADPYGRANVLFDDAGEVAGAYRAHGTPTAVLISAAGEIAAPPAAGVTAIEDLAAERVNGLVRRRRQGTLDLCVELVRRELLVRGAGALAAAGAMLSRPVTAFAGGGGGGGGGGGRGCGNRCGAEQECINTRCVCTRYRAPDKCGRKCTDFRTDPDNCGGCYQVPPMEDVPRGRRRGASDHACAPGQGCVAGQCTGGDGSICDVSDPGNVCCNGDEADLNFQIDNCGACGNVCSDGADPACCYGRCVDLKKDPNNCNACGNRCPEGEVCRNGACKPCRNDDDRICRGPEGRRCFDPKRQGCCGGRVFSRRGGKECCAQAGFVVYDPDEFMCCEGELIEASPDQFFCP
jgi:hypothetical protein